MLSVDVLFIGLSKAVYYKKNDFKNVISLNRIIGYRVKFKFTIN